MTLRRRKLPIAAKLALLALVVATGALALAREDGPALAAGNTQIFVSNSSSCGAANAITSDVVFVGGPPREVWVCASGIKDPAGAVGMAIDFSYISWLLAVSGLSNAEGQVWLGTTGRSVSCGPITVEPNPETGWGRAYTGCDSLSPPPPAGVMANGLLGKVTLQGGPAKGSTPVDFRDGDITAGTFLVSGNFNPLDPYGTASRIPSTSPVLTVYIAPCADYEPTPPPNHDDYVSIFDILHLANRFTWSPSNPGWNSDYDMDANNFVNIFDILIAARQFGRTCPP